MLLTALFNRQGGERWYMYMLCLAGCRPEQMMMYAGSKNKLVHTVQLSKVSERLLTKLLIHDKTLVLTEISGHGF